MTAASGGRASVGGWEATGGSGTAGAVSAAGAAGAASGQRVGAVSAAGAAGAVSAAGAAGAISAAGAAGAISAAGAAGAASAGGAAGAASAAGAAGAASGQRVGAETEEARRGMLAGRTAIVTGGASGIGLGIVQRFLAEGARVLVVDRDGAACASLGERAPGAAHQVSDVREAEAWRRAVASCLDRWGRLDCLVNNAGVSMAGSLLQVSESAWDEVFAVNVRGALLGLQAAVPAMERSGGGSVVNIGSISTRTCYPMHGAYSPSKAALENLTRQAAVEFAPLRVRVNAVSPGWVRTALTAATYAVPGVLARRSATVPLGHIGTVEEVAALTAFLASDDAAYITGESIEIDGGLWAGSLAATGRLAQVRPVEGA